MSWFSRFTPYAVCFAVSAAALLAPLPIRAQDTTATIPTIPPAAQAMAQRMAGSGPITHAQIAEWIRQSGMSRDQLRSRIEGLGHDPRIADAYFDIIENGTAPSNAPVPAELLSALQAAGVRIPLNINAAGVLVDSLGAPVGDTVDPLFSILDMAPDTIFGQKLFRRTTSQFDAAVTGPPSADYRLGPGDELTVFLTGDVELSQNVTILPDGGFSLPNVGRVSAAGLTLAQLEDRLFRQLADVYSGVGSTTQLQVSLTRLRTNQVYVIGEVRMLGAYNVNANATVFTALYHAGGPTDVGSMREVEVRRGNQVVAKVDIYDYLLRGAGSSDIRLQHGDIVFVPITGPRVRTAGALRRQMIFELAPGDGLTDLIGYAGGFSANALAQRVQVDRILPSSARRPGIDRVFMDVDMQAIRNQGQDFELRDGDRVQVFAVNEERRNRLSVTGEVERPGVYEWTAGMTLYELIRNAGGLSEDAYTPRAHIYRLNAADGDLSLIRTELLADAGARDVMLADRDSIVIYSRAELRNARFVNIEGFVKNPGTYPLAEGMTLKDLVLTAGGFTYGAYVVEAEVAREPESLLDARTPAPVFRVPLAESPQALNADGSIRYSTNGEAEGMPRSAARTEVPTWAPDANEFVLRHGDRVAIRKAPGYEAQRTVMVTGGVKFGGQYVLRNRGERLTDLLARAGGLMPDANIRGLQIIRGQDLVATDVEEALEDPDSRYNLVLEAGDSVHVPALDPTVLVQGAVAYETRVLYRPGAGLGYYVEQAGGYLQAGDEDRVTVTYPNGERRLVGSFLGFNSAPEVQPGSTINVPEKPPSEQEPFDWVRFISQTIAIATSALTAIVLADGLKE